MTSNAVIFDMDGTLVDNTDYHRKSWYTFYKKYKTHINKECFKRNTPGTMKEILSAYFKHPLSSDDITNLSEEKEGLYRALYADHLKPISGLTSFLQVLNSKNVPIALANMGQKTNIDFILDGLHIRHYFDIILGAEDIEKGKPNPEIFLKASDQVQPDKCLVIEDSFSGILAGKRANMNVIGITTSHSSEHLLNKGASTTIDTYSIKYQRTILNLLQID